LIPVLAFVCVLGFLYEEHAFKHQQKSTWTAISATIEQTRYHPIARYSLEYGSKDLYEVDVLTTYNVKDVQQRNWVPLSTTPMSLAQAQSTSNLKGTQCLVRWDQAHPDQKIAELH
jgi:hypothetical protein